MTTHPLPTLILMYCDHELPPDEREAFERRLVKEPDLAKQVADCQALRRVVGQTMREQTSAAPVGFVEQIRSMLQAEPTSVHGEAEAAGFRFTSGDDSQTAGSERNKRESWVLANLRWSPFAMAACLVIVAGAILFGIFGPRIGTQSTLSDSETAVLMQKAGVWALRHHAQCMNNASIRKQELIYRQRALAKQEISSHVGAMVEIFNLAPLEYDFLAGGICHVPGAEEHSAHYVYQRRSDEAMISILVARDKGQYGLTPGRFESLNLTHPTHTDSPDVIAWTDGRVAYFLAAGDRSDYRAIRRQIGLAMNTNR